MFKNKWLRVGVLAFPLTAIVQCGPQPAESQQATQTQNGNTVRTSHSTPTPESNIGPMLPADLRRAGACNGADYLHLGGNIDSCANRCSGYINLGPAPGSAAINATVTFGITPHGFNLAGDTIEETVMTIDFGNGTTSGPLPLVNDQGRQATTTYKTAGTYHVQGLAVSQGFYKANDWSCRYRCCRWQHTQIEIK